MDQGTERLAEEERKREQRGFLEQGRTGGTKLDAVCAWRGWRLPHEALRAELSYPHSDAGSDLITLPYT